MTAPVNELLSSMETLLSTGAGFITLGLFNEGIQIYRGDAPVELPTPHLALQQAGPCKERHERGSGLWDIPVAARLTLDRNGDLGDTAAEIEAAVRSYADNLKAILTMNLRINPANEAAGFSTPEQRLTDDDIHVWEISDVEMDADTEMDGDPVCEIRFTAYCGHTATII